jgi:hypothetical protein
MRSTTIELDEQLWDLVEAEAARQGISTAQFMREATLLRVAALAGRRGDVDLLQDVEDLAARSERRARRSDAEVPDAMVILHDPGRLAALTASGLLDSAQEERFDHVTRLASRTLHAPTALISVVDGDHQVFKSSIGLADDLAAAGQTPLSHSFCQHVVATGRPLVVSDAREDPLLRTNRAVDEHGTIAYAGVPLTTRDGHTLGALCAIDERPREWSADDIEALVDLAASAVAEIERGGDRRA